MSDDHRAARERLFWERYTRLLHDQGINPPFDQWHVRRAKAFIGQFPGRRLGELGAQDVADYLTRVGHEAALKPWQFRQVVDAIRSLYSIVRTVRGLLGHSDVSTTMIYTHVLNRGGMGVLSPLDTV